MSAAPADSQAPLWVHGNALLIGAHGALLRGPSDAGKSRLTLDLIDYAQSRGLFARLIGDDRVALAVHHGRIVARPHPAIAGRIESRGRGVLNRPFEPAGVIHMVVDLIGADSAPPERLPPPEALAVNLCGISLPRLRVDAGAASAAREITSFIHGLGLN
jgi:HPr kinase/phosphorylase